MNVLQRVRQVAPTRTAMGRLWLWGLLASDVVVLVWMATLGTWLDAFSPVTAVATLGGHHEIVMVLAAIGGVLLAGLAVLTQGFVVVDRKQGAAISVACVVSVIAVAGLVSFILAALLGRLLFGGIRG